MTGGLLRRLLLRASRSDRLRRWARGSPLVRRAVRRFMPGEEPGDALSAAARLAEEGVDAVLTCLGENVESESEAAAVRDHYLALLEETAGHPADPELSVKLTHLGLDLSPGLVRESLAALARASADLGRTLWIDMESFPYVDPTLDLFLDLRAEGAEVGVCLQAYLYRTPEDLERVLEAGGGIRLVKGAYDEPEEVAHPGREEVDRSFRRLARRTLEAAGGPVRPAFATHDGALHAAVRRAARERGVEPGEYEFQMLYGIRAAAQRRLADQGEAVRTLISYGSHWFPWYVRRLAERPANLLLLLRHALPG